MVIAIYLPWFDFLNSSEKPSMIFLPISIVFSILAQESESFLGDGWLGMDLGNFYNMIRIYHLFII